MAIDPKHFEGIAKFFRILNRANSYNNINLHDIDVYHRSLTKILDQNKGLNPKEIVEYIISLYDNMIKSKKLFDSEEHKNKTLEILKNHRSFSYALDILIKSYNDNLKYIDFVINNEQIKAEFFNDLKCGELHFDGRCIYKDSMGIEFTNEQGETIKLGKFRMKLLLSNTMNESPADCIEIVALTPNPSKPKPSCTHPHVQNNHLCMGDGHAAICDAIKTCRILDLFDLLESILNTYNETSPHANLESWNYEHKCSVCSIFKDDDEMTLCECDRYVCEDCSKTCDGCGKFSCGHCLEITCKECGDRFCSIDCCPNKCAMCSKYFCDGCVVGGAECKCGSILCNTCKKSGCECEMEEISV